MTGSWLVAGAIGAALLAPAARAHEFSCDVRVNGGELIEVTQYPAKLELRIDVTNTHPTHASTALRMQDSLLEKLGLSFQPATPFTLLVGESIRFEQAIEVKDRAACLALVGPQACGSAADEIVRIAYAEGERQCRARIVCGEERPSGATGEKGTVHAD